MSALAIDNIALLVTNDPSQGPVIDASLVVEEGRVVSSIKRNDQRSTGIAVILTVVLGLAVFNAQWYSIVRARFSIGDHAYATLFYLLMGYHALHVALGIGAVILVGSRAVAGHYGRENYDPVRATAALWQYGNVAWAVILVVMFLFSPS